MQQSVFPDYREPAAAAIPTPAGQTVPSNCEPKQTFPQVVFVSYSVVAMRTTANTSRAPIILIDD